MNLVQDASFQGDFVLFLCVVADEVPNILSFVYFCVRVLLLQIENLM